MQTQNLHNNSFRRPRNPGKWRLYRRFIGAAGILAAMSMAAGVQAQTIRPLPQTAS